MIDRLARLRLFGEEYESGVSGDASVALAPKRTVTAIVSARLRAAFGNKKKLFAVARTSSGRLAQIRVSGFSLLYHRYISSQFRQDVITRSRSHRVRPTSRSGHRPCPKFACPCPWCACLPLSDSCPGPLRVAQWTGRVRTFHVIYEKPRANAQYEWATVCRANFGGGRRPEVHTVYAERRPATTTKATHTHFTSDKGHTHTDTPTLEGRQSQADRPTGWASSGAHSVGSFAASERCLSTMYQALHSR